MIVSAVSRGGGRSRSRPRSSSSANWPADRYAPSSARVEHGLQLPAGARRPWRRAGARATPRRTRRAARRRGGRRGRRGARRRAASTQMRSAISGGGGAPASSSASTAEATWRAMRIAGAEPIGPSARTSSRRRPGGRLGDRDRAALERARVVDAEQVRVVDGAEPVGALEEADRRQRAGRVARDVQRDGAALALGRRAAPRRWNPRARRHRCDSRRTRPRVARSPTIGSPDGSHPSGRRILRSVRAPRSSPRRTWPPAAA